MPMDTMMPLLLLFLNVVAIGARYAVLNELEVDDEYVDLDEDDQEISPLEDYHMLVSGGTIINRPMNVASIISLRIRFKVIGDQHYCAGILVTTDWVVTAARCVYNRKKIKMRPRQLRVAMGLSNRFQTPRDDFDMGVSAIITHLSYLRHKLAKDIALLHLEKPISRKRLRFASLALHPPKVGQTCIVLGWGQLFVNGPFATNLLYAEVKIISREECKHYIPDLGDDIFCATGVKIEADVCIGDTGGPMFCDGYLQGIITKVQGCSGYLPSTYTNVYKHKNWILDIANVAPRLLRCPTLFNFSLFVYLLSRMIV